MQRPRGTPHRLRRLAAATVCATLVAASCGGDDDDDAGSGPAPTDAAGGTSAAAPPDVDTTSGPADTSAASTPGGGSSSGATQEGDLSDVTGEFDPAGTLRFGYTIGPSQGLDPHKTSLAQDTVWLAPIYDPLIIEMPDSTLVPGLATAWEFVDDDTVLELTLREGVTFHDGGQFDADVVKANIERAKTIEGSAVAPLLAVVESVDVVDDVTVRLNLSGPAVTLPRILADRPGMMISPDGLDDPDLGNNPAGAGMYRVTEYRQGDRAVMTRFEDYWNPEWNLLGGLEIVQMGDSATRLNAVQSGELELALLDPTQYDAADRAGTLDTQEFQTASVTYLQPNRTRAHMDDVRVRQALMYGIDREAIVEAVLLGYANPSPQWYGSAFEVGHIPELDDMYPYDPDKARALLEEAGLTDQVSIEFLVPTLPINEQIAQIAQAQYAEIGVTVTFRSVEATQTASTFYTDLLGDIVVGTTPGRTDPAMYMQLFFTEEAHSNPGKHTIPAVTEAYQAALEVLPDEEREPLLEDLMRVVVEEAGVINLYQGLTLLAGTDEMIGGFHWSLRGQPDFRGVGVAAG
jgi:peptide/nickel transport system substrate-binding protein